jgi:hypothetical protein
MFRWTVLGLPLLSAAFFGVGAKIQAQAPEPHGLDPKEIAKAKFELTQASPEQLARARLATARHRWQGELEKITAGQKTSDLDTLDSSRQLLEAELGLRSDKRSRIAALKSHWRRTKAIETIVERLIGARPWRGFSDFLETNYWRLEAELWLAEATADSGKPRKMADILLTLGGEGEIGVEGFSERDRLVARALFQVAQADPQTLALAKCVAARQAWNAELDSIEAGQKSPDWQTISYLRRCIESQRALQTDRAKASVVTDHCWQFPRIAEEVGERKFRAGARPMDIRGLLQLKYERLQVEKELQRAQGGETISTPGDAKEIARAKFEAAQAGPGKIAQAQHEMARQGLAAELEVIGAGQKAPDWYTVRWVRRLMESQRAIHASRAEDLAAMDDCWLLAKELEKICERLYRRRARAMDITQFAPFKVLRLEVEMEWKRAQAKVKEK